MCIYTQTDTNKTIAHAMNTACLSTEIAADRHASSFVCVVRVCVVCVRECVCACVRVCVRACLYVSCIYLACEKA